ncbi:MAG: tetratricopeptide repeat protein [Chitinophagaceae bacterium]|nr:MAG: tetratricopeptide repeat protein [Chitinophagaceae bacterium]
MMPKYLLLAILLTGGAFFASAQDTTYQRIIAAKDDSAKVIQLANYAYPFTTTDTAKAQKAYNELMRLSRKLNYPYWIGMVWVNRGYMSALAVNDRQAISNYDTAIYYLRKTTRVDKIALCHLNLGSIKERQGKVNDKVGHLTEAMRLLENTKYKDLLNHVYNSMGVLFFNLGEFEKGLTYFQKGLQLAKEEKDTANHVEALHGIVNCLSSQKHFKEAFSYGDELMAVATASKDNGCLLHAHTGLTDLYRRNQQAGPAIEHAKKIVQYAISGNDLQYQLIGYLSMADGYQLAKDYRKSIEFYNKALVLGTEKDVVIQLDDIYKGLSDAYEQIKETGKAFSFYKLYIANRDSANTVKTRNNATELDIKYQTAQKEKDLSLNQLQIAQKEVQLQKSRQMSLYGIGAAVVALMVALLVFFHFGSKRKLHQKQLQTMQQEKEIQLLQAVMQGEEKERSRIAKDLHDGVAGMLAAVKMHFTTIALHVGGVLQTEGYQQGIHLLDEASQEVRKTSHNLMPEVLLQHGLDEAMRRYCNNVTNSSKLLVEYNSIGEIGRFIDSFELSVYRIVQELLNNIVKHSKASEAIVQITYQSGLLSITIEDNGIGMTKDAQHKDGIGLRSLQSRVKAMNGKIEFDSAAGQGLNAYLEFETAGLEKEAEFSIA